MVQIVTRFPLTIFPHFGNINLGQDSTLHHIVVPVAVLSKDGGVARDPSIGAQ